MPKKVTKTIESLAEIGLENPLQAIPVPEQGVETKYDPKSRAQLRRVLPPKRGMYAWISKRMGYQHFTRIDLDEGGSLFWKEVDGKTSLNEVANRLKESFDCTHEQAIKACLTFSRELMLRRMICLRIPGDEDQPARDLRMTSQ